MKWLLPIFLVLVVSASAQQVVDLTIVEGVVSNGNYDIPYFNFSRSQEFDSSNAILRFSPGDEVTFRVTNSVDFTCGFRVAGHGLIERIATDETAELTVTFPESGSFLYDDPNPDHRALGLGGLLVVSDFSGPEFFGVFSEHDEEWITAIAEGGSYDRRTYAPDAFTVNGKGFPRTMHDSLAYISGSVGDTILIHMANAGIMYHFPHWHGYHVTILSASHQKRYVGWVKDSYGMEPGETMTVQLVPDKPGKYPMHNHNLVTTTIGGNYPGGMMMHMHIHE